MPMKATQATLSLFSLCLFLLSSYTVHANVGLVVSSGSGHNWIAVQITNSAVAASTIEIKQASATAYTTMTYEGSGVNAGWWTYSDWSKTAGFDMPLSFRLTGTNGGIIVMNSVTPNLDNTQQTIDTGVDAFSTSSVELVVSSGSGHNWIAVQITNSAIAASTIEIKQASATAYTVMTYDSAGINAGWWSYGDWSKANGFDMPFSFRLTGTNGGVIVVSSVSPTLAGTQQTIDTGFAFSGSTAQSSCAEPFKILVPLYVYPGSAWDQVIAGAQYAKTIAIINPASGPLPTPDDHYVDYMTKLHNAGVEMVGYVHTNRGTRDLVDVQADIHNYTTSWPLITGIFLDQCDTYASSLSYYNTLYSYIMAVPGYKYDIINPGTVPDEGYLNVATQIVTLEDYSYKVASATVPSWASCATKEKYVAIVHDVPSSSMQSTVDAVVNKGYFGYIYITDGVGETTTYNTLSTYYTSEAAYIGAHST